MIPINLFYRSATNWIPLPDWGTYFVEIGMALANYDNTQKRVIAGLALPTLSYAAPLISLGITLGEITPVNEKNEATKRFQQLSSLNKDTPLFYRQNQKKKLTKVFFAGLKQDNGEAKIHLDTKTNGEGYFITPQQAFQVEFPAKDFPAILKRPSRRITSHLSPFISNLLDASRVATITSRSSLDSVTIGSLYRLKEEVQGRQFAAQKDGEFIHGSLQDIIRVRAFLKDTETYRSEIYSVNSNECTNLSQEIPTVVVFDGAKSFLKWRTFWLQSHWVVLLDQTELDFDLAIQAFNHEYVMSSAHERDVCGFPLAPTNIPVAIYQEER